jgi:hypothetical protein
MSVVLLKNFSKLYKIVIEYEQHCHENACNKPEDGREVTEGLV